MNSSRDNDELEREKEREREEDNRSIGSHASKGSRKSKKKESSLGGNKLRAGYIASPRKS